MDIRDENIDIWKLYSIGKESLPYKERILNLSWRLQNKSLKRKMIANEQDNISKDIIQNLKEFDKVASFDEYINNNDSFFNNQYLDDINEFNYYDNASVTTDNTMTLNNMSNNNNFINDNDNSNSMFGNDDTFSSNLTTPMALPMTIPMDIPRTSSSIFDFVTMTPPTSISNDSISTSLPINIPINHSSSYTNIQLRKQPKQKRRKSSVNEKMKCSNCGTSTTPLWRKDSNGNSLCNACGLFLKLHGVMRPLSLKTDVIKKRQRNSSNNTSNTANSRNNGTTSTSNVTVGASLKRNYGMKKVSAQDKINLDWLNF